MRKTIILAASVAILVAACVIGLMRGTDLFRPRNIEDVFARIYKEAITSDPDFVRANLDTLIQLKNTGEIQLPDLSHEGFLKRTEASKDWNAYLDRFDAAPLNNEQLTHLAIVKRWLNISEASEKFEAYSFPITHLWGPHLEDQELFATLSVRSKADIEQYLRLLQNVESQFGDLIDGLESRRKQNITLPTFILKQVIAQCNLVATSDADSTVFYRSFENDLNRIKLIDPQSRAEYLAECSRIVKENVIPAYQRLTAYLLQLERASLSISGLWQFEGGSEYYKHCILKYSESTNAPDTLYEIAKQELAVLEGQTQIISELAKTKRAFTTNSKNDSSLAMGLASTKLSNWYLSDLITPSVVEGWKLYSSGTTINGSYGSSTQLYSDHLQQDREATAMMLIDLGIHEKRWLREQAIAFYLKHLDGRQEEAIAAVDRIIVDPGRATAAKIGQMRFKELEEWARSELKDAYRPSEFRTVLTQNGPTTFAELEKAVRGYILSRSKPT